MIKTVLLSLLVAFSFIVTLFLFCSCKLAKEADARDLDNRS